MSTASFSAPTPSVTPALLPPHTEVCGQGVCTREEAQASPTVVTGGELGLSRRFAVRQLPHGRMFLTLEVRRRESDEFTVQDVYADPIHSLFDGRKKVAECTREWKICDAEDRESAWEALSQERLTDW